MAGSFSLNADSAPPPHMPRPLSFIPVRCSSLEETRMPFVLPVLLRHSSPGTITPPWCCPKPLNSKQPTVRKGHPVPQCLPLLASFLIRRLWSRSTGAPITTRHTSRGKSFGHLMAVSLERRMRNGRLKQGGRFLVTKPDKYTRSGGRISF